MLDTIKFYWNAVCRTTSGSSRAFWLYCALLSLLIVPMAIGQIRRAPTFSGGRIGAISTKRGDPRVGAGMLVFESILLIVLLTNAFRKP